MDINYGQFAIDQSRLMRVNQQLETGKLKTMSVDSADEKKMKKVAQDFESIFVKQLLDAMDKTVDRSDSMLSGGNTEEYFRDMFNDAVANSLSHRPGGSGLGLAEAIYKQLAKQEKPDKPALAMPQGPVIGQPDSGIGISESQ